MLRRCLIVAALLAAGGCKKADNKEVPNSTGPEHGSASASDTQQPEGSASGSAEASGTATDPLPDKGSDTVAKGTGSSKPNPRGSGNPTAGTETTTGDDSYQLTVTPPAVVTAGKPAIARLAVKPIGGYHMNDEFPTQLKLETPDGVTLAKNVFELADAEAFDKNQLVFAVECTPGASGEYTVSGKLKFAVCTDATCDPKRQSISFKVAAK